jgi:Tfp pilus assembly PilM family ATPase
MAGSGTKKDLTGCGEIAEKIRRSIHLFLAFSARSALKFFALEGGMAVQ